MEVKREVTYSVTWNHDGRDMEISGPDGYGEFTLDMDGCSHGFTPEGLMKLAEAINSIEKSDFNAILKHVGLNLGQE